MVAPVEIYIGSSRLTGWTGMRLSRSKEELTGTLSVSIFYGYVPDAPVLVQATRGEDISVYIGGSLAFFGKLDSRKGSSGASSSISPDSYTVTLSARGQTKYLIDSSVQQTDNLNGLTTREILQQLISPWGVEIEWLATDVTLDKERLRDGANVVDEIHRICTENAYFVYETADGRLRITDDTGRTFGENIELGKNILTFSAEQSEALSKSRITVKGQRTPKGVWGEEAILKSLTTVEDAWVGATIPYTIQHYGDATPEALERRAKFEANKRSSAAKTISVEVFDVETSSGVPWDIGSLHRVSIPPEGVFDVFECVGITYTAEAPNTLKTALKLSPPPADSISGGSSAGGGGLLSVASGFSSNGISLTLDPARGRVTVVQGQYPSSWSGPALSVLAAPLSLAPIVATGLAAFGSFVTAKRKTLNDAASEDKQ